MSSDLGRRLLTVPGYALAFALLISLAPLLLPTLVVADLLRQTPLALSRTFLFAIHYFACEVLGILVSSWLWLRHRVFGKRDPEGWIASHYRLQWWWADTLLSGACFLFGLRIEVEGEDVVPRGDGPFHLLVRHVSVGDTLLAAVYLSRRHGHRLRYVLKRELLWDPCLDIVGQRIPNCFVDRGGEDSEGEIARVRALAADLGPSDGVLIYPEGTRFTPQRRAAVLEKARRPGREELLARAEALEHVLPPRTGGTLALLDERPDVDVVVCMHVGFDGTMRLTDLVSGALVGTTVRVRFDRISADTIPRDGEGRSRWLFDLWTDVDRWVGEQERELRESAARGR